MSIYEKTASQLLTEYIQTNLKLGQTVEKGDIVQWFKENYPKVKSTTVNSLIIAFTKNREIRICPKDPYETYPDYVKLFRLPNGRLRLCNSKRQVRILISDLPNNVSESLSDVIKQVIGDKYDSKFVTTPYAHELLEFAEGHMFDIFILILNNIILLSENVSTQNRLEKSLEIVTHLTEKYRRPVIALAGWPDDPSFAERAKLAGARFFFRLPVKPKDFGVAVEQCLETVAGFKKMS